VKPQRYYYVFRTVGPDGTPEDRDLSSPEPFFVGQELVGSHGGLPAMVRVERIEEVADFDRRLLVTQVIPD
jgi:inorganic pyrophosphatase